MKNPHHRTRSIRRRCAASSAVHQDEGRRLLVPHADTSSAGLVLATPAVPPCHSRIAPRTRTLTHVSPAVSDATGCQGGQSARKWTRHLSAAAVSAGGMPQPELREGLLAGSPARSHTLQIEEPRSLARQYSTGAKVKASKLRQKFHHLRCLQRECDVRQPCAQGYG